MGSCPDADIDPNFFLVCLIFKTSKFLLGLMM